MISQRWINEENKKVNILLIVVYGLSILLTIPEVEVEFKGILFYDFFISMLVLFFYYLRLINITIFKHSIFNYIFVYLVTITIFIGGSYNSLLFPTLFMIPVLFGVLNLNMQNSMGVSIFSIAIIWLILLQDPNLTKIGEVIFNSFYIIIFQVILGVLKDGFVNKKKNISRSYIEYKIKKENSTNEDIEK